MKYSRSHLFPDVILINPTLFIDDRGYFFEGYQRERYEEIGIHTLFVQDNFSRSVKNTLRGLHYQRFYPQGKLVGVTAGIVYDVIVDIRYGSPTFGKWMGVTLNAEHHTQIYIPPGFAHGFCVLSEFADFYYKCTNYYVSTDDCGIAWNDKTLNIEWPLQTAPLLSSKDKQYLSLQATAIDKLPRYASP